MKEKPFAITIVPQCEYRVSLHKRKSINLTKFDVDLLLEYLAKEPDFNNKMKSLVV